MSSVYIGKLFDGTVGSVGVIGEAILISGIITLILQIIKWAFIIGGRCRSIGFKCILKGRGICIVYTYAGNTLVINCKTLVGVECFAVLHIIVITNVICLLKG